jgi:hypothetical protein
MALGLNAVKASVFRRSRQQALTGPEQTTRYAGGADVSFYAQRAREPVPTIAPAYSSHFKVDLL